MNKIIIFVINSADGTMLNIRKHDQQLYCEDTYDFLSNLVVASTSDAYIALRYKTDKSKVTRFLLVQMPLQDMTNNRITPPSKEVVFPSGGDPLALSFVKDNTNLYLVALDHTY